MSRKTELMEAIMDAMIELAELNEHSVLEEVADMHNSLKTVLDEVPEDERTPVRWA